MTGHPGSQKMLAGALAYARRGWPVFPCRPGRKEPDTAHGFKDATTDPGRITAWWTAEPARNVAIATGTPGPDVLDVDVRPSGSGYPALHRLQRAGLLQGAVAAVVTPSGGMHLYYHGSGQASGRLPERHLDFKATGGYVLAPPSAAAGKPYRVIRHQPGRTGQTAEGRLDWAAAVALVEPRQPHPQPGRPPGRGDTGRLAAWVARLPEGNRNAGLFWAACRAAETGHPEALDALAEAALTAGLPEPEVTATIASARRSTGRERPARSQSPHAEPRADHDSEAVI
jgi:Bifunctional DNA primase/polymerase, N-terminal